MGERLPHARRIEVVDQAQQGADSLFVARAGPAALTGAT